MGQLTVDVGALLPKKTSKKDAAKQSYNMKDRAGIAFPRYFTAKLETGRTP